MEPPYVTRDNVTTDNSGVISGPSNSQEQTTMDVSFNDKILFSTPQIRRRDDQIQGSATMSVRSIYSIDSGFSDTTFNSTWTSSVNDMSSSLSARSFPDSEGDSCRRLSLTAGEFSPINRGPTSSLSGRRLKFDNQCSNEYADLCLDQNESVSLTKQSTGLFCQSTSINTDDIKSSLQVMAIDEQISPNTITRLTPVQLCESCRHKYCTTRKKTALLPHHHSSGADIKTITSIRGHCTDMAATCSNNVLRFPDISNNETHHQRTGTEIGCITELHLTPSSQEESEIQTHTATSHQFRFRKSKSQSASETHEIYQDNKSSLETDCILNREAPRVCYNYSPLQSIFDRHDCTAINKDNNYKLFTFTAPVHALQKRRSNQCEKGSCFNFNLNKLRKIESNCQSHTDDETAVIISNSTKNATRMILEKVIKKFSPLEPTRLIGRNIGVRKVDIMQELHSKNIWPGLERIFQYLAVEDLNSIASVSTQWKQAMYSDKKAYNRYRQHKKSLSKSNVQLVAGKENCGEKTLDALPEQSLTKPRGLLSSMQSQASRSFVSERPPVAAKQDTLMSEDVLRVCPRCQGPAMIKQRQDRATCTSEKCSYDFCTLCLSSFHHPRQCKPLCRATSKGDVAGTRNSKKNLKRL